MTQTMKHPQWPCWDANEKGNLVAETRRCVFLEYFGQTNKVRCIKDNFRECERDQLKIFMQNNWCPTIDEEQRADRIVGAAESQSEAARSQAESAKVMAKWSRISTVIVFLWLVVAMLNLMFPNGF